MAKPTATAARLTISTGRVALVRRSTIGERARSCHHAHTGSTTAEVASRPRVRLLVHPHDAPLDTASRNVTKPTDRPTAPGRSNVSSAATLIGDFGTTSRTSTVNIMAR